MSLLTREEWMALGDQCTKNDMQNSMKYEKLIEAALLAKLATMGVTLVRVNRPTATGTIFQIMVHGNAAVQPSQVDTPPATHTSPQIKDPNAAHPCFN